MTGTSTTATPKSTTWTFTAPQGVNTNTNYTDQIGIQIFEPGNGANGPTQVTVIMVDQGTAQPDYLQAQVTVAPPIVVSINAAGLTTALTQYISAGAPGANPAFTAAMNLPNFVLNFVNDVLNTVTTSFQPVSAVAPNSFTVEANAASNPVTINWGAVTLRVITLAGGNTVTITSSDIGNLSTGMLVSGPGIPAGTTITQVSPVTDANGNVTGGNITLSNSAANTGLVNLNFAANGSFAIGNPTYVNRLSPIPGISFSLYQILFGQNTGVGPLVPESPAAKAYAFGQAMQQGGTIWMGIPFNVTAALNAGVDSYGVVLGQVLVHELGHSLGLLDAYLSPGSQPQAPMDIMAFGGIAGGINPATPASMFADQNLTALKYTVGTELNSGASQANWESLINALNMYETNWNLPNSLSAPVDVLQPQPQPQPTSTPMPPPTPTPPSADLDARPRGVDGHL